MNLWVYLVSGVLRGTAVFRWRQLDKILRNVREYEFVPVKGRSLAQATRLHFQTHTPALVLLWFDLIGDFRMKSKPVEVYDRIFIGYDGQTVATICSLLHGGGVSLISVLSNGMCVHSVSVTDPRPERTFAPADQLQVCYLPGASVDALHDRHQRTLRKLSKKTGSSALHFRRDKFREVLVYDQRVFNRWRHRHGCLDHQPPAPDFNSLLGAPGQLPLAHDQRIEQA
jgi:hypothetical protein